ncbi:MAG: phosphatidylglycerophosphatase A [Flavisolibacter sp.]|jgi:phosphatidylglycerophosphatase A|nr:phosphatidylglycerophosphatase A [Flavisolibacter sp.]
MFTAKLISTFLGIGYIRKGGGTVAALVFCVAWWLLAPERGFPPVFYLLFAILIFFIGLWSSTIVETLWGKDSNKVVIDEVLGMLVSLFMMPVKWPYLLIAFILFRFFDILKPLFIRSAEDLPAGWGVMTDDLLAGIYANIIMQLIILSAILE